MKLTKIAILALKGLGRDGRKRIAEEMGLKEDTLYRWIRINDDNLTKAGYLAVICRELGLTDSELLETETIGQDTAA